MPRPATVHNEQSQKITAFIQQYYGLNGYAPSLAEITKALGLSKTSTNYRLKQMVKKGELFYNEKVARSFRLPGQVTIFSRTALLANPNKKDSKENASNPNRPGGTR